jgi:acetoin:2,6-dichlorophenolindophenol oxidoreductase subunit beta
MRLCTRLQHPTSSPRGSQLPAETDIELRDAICQALEEELERDERVVFFGEDVAEAGGVFAVSKGLLEKFGPTRVFDTPISELALTGAAFGSAVCGLRPVVEIMFGDFLTLSMDSLVNQASKYWFLTQQQGVPLVVRSVVGAGGRFGAIHSQMPASWFMSVPGMKIACPAFPADAKGLLKAAIRDENPVLFFEHKRLYSIRGPVDDGEVVPLGSARVVRRGTDVTIVGAMKSVHDGLAAAELLAADGISAEVIDLRTLRPLDAETILASIEQTNRLVVVEEGPRTGGWAGEVLAIATERALGLIDAAWRITTADSPIPYSPPLEDAFLPSAEGIAAEIRSRLQPTRT